MQIWLHILFAWNVSSIVLLVTISLHFISKLQMLWNFSISCSTKDWHWKKLKESSLYLKCILYSFMLHCFALCFSQVLCRFICSGILSYVALPECYSMSVLYLLAIFEGFIKPKTIYSQSSSIFSFPLTIWANFPSDTAISVNTHLFFVFFFSLFVSPSAYINF